KKLWLQDESSFHANDMEYCVYLAPGKQQLRKKGRGRLVHVSDFVLESTGCLVLPAHVIDELKEGTKWTDCLNTYGGDAHKIIYLGENHDAWWDMKQLLKQVEVAIDIFNILHPNDVAVFIFDCLSAHKAFAPDALSVQKMNVKPGGNQPRMHDTVIPNDCPILSKRGTHQSMVFMATETSDPKLIGVPKGMARICEEWGLTCIIAAANNGQVVGTCQSCEMSASQRTQLEEEARKYLEEDGKHIDLDDITLGVLHARKDCCMSQALALQSDFACEKSMLQMVIEAAGHQCIFLPKFHCELNPIEPVWGFARHEFSELADGTFATAQREVSICLDKCGTIIIWRFFCKCYQYMDAYRKGLSGKEADHAVRKYKSHHKVGWGIVMDINMIIS
ncbi:hypothetical protein K439DRAFT_1344462, partial [Ramaria rubella]